MQSTFTNGLSVAFKGSEICPGSPQYIANGGTRTLNGFISNDNTNKAYFGTALFIDPDAPNELFVGPTEDATDFRGILMNRPMVNEQFPGHADFIVNGCQADAFYEGAIWCSVAGTVAIGADVYAKADGTLTVVSTSNTNINGKVKAKDESTGLYLVYFDGTPAPAEEEVSPDPGPNA